FQFAQLPGWSNNPAKEFNAMLDKDWHANMPNYGDLAKPRTLDIMAALNRMRKSQFKPSN
ncbi:isopentenyl-diphosphate delta-isomerase, partial [Vibrio fortis]